MRSALLLTIFATCIGLSYPVDVARAQQDNDRLIGDIRSAYDALDFPVAEARIDAALGAYERFLPAELSEIHVIYALILFARNDLPAARSQLSQALQLAPALTLDPLDTPPRLLEVFAELKEERAAQPDRPASQAEVRYLVVHDPRAEAAIRSMIAPGWGQLYKGEKKKGIVLAGLWGVTAGGALFAHIKRQSARDHYLASETQAQTLDRFGAYSTWHKVRNNLFLGAVGIWAYSYIDAVLRGQPAPAGAGNAGPFSFHIAPIPGGTHFSLTVPF